MRKLATISLLASLMVFGCGSTPSASNTSRESNNRVTPASGELYQWINNELTDYLAKNIGEVPKFKNEPILIVSMKNEQISPDINGLVADIRSQLMDNLLANRNVKLVRRQLDYRNTHHRSLTRLSCDTETDIRYYIGLEVDKSSVTGDYTIRIRAMEAENPDQWVQGISTKWSGALTAGQERALNDEEKDPYLQGLRSRPFSSGESDLLAQYVSHNLSCLLASGTYPELKLFTKPIEDVNSDVKTVVNLVDNYLSRFQEVELSDKLDTANAVMAYEFFNIDRRAKLSMMNVSIKFKESGERAKGIDTQAYIGMPIRNNGKPTRTTTQASSARKADLIENFEFRLPKRSSYCDRRDPWALGETSSKTPILNENDCFAIEYSTKGREEYLIYENTHGQFYSIDGSCLSIEHSRRIKRVPSINGNPPVISLDNSRGFERFHLLSFKHAMKRSDLQNIVERLPTLCRSGGQGTTSRAFSNAIKDYHRNNLGQLDYETIAIDHR
ncbi:MAG: hypothetical protein GJ680_07275 [Alteromonadaceae bacterium]|nr:hypothetical protein [Alteromonadaceae bacterium]